MVRVELRPEVTAEFTTRPIEVTGTLLVRTASKDESFLADSSSGSVLAYRMIDCVATVTP
jgi:hypothetical protein